MQGETGHKDPYYIHQHERIEVFGWWEGLINVQKGHSRAMGLQAPH